MSNYYMRLFNYSVSYAIYQNKIYNINELKGNIIIMKKEFVKFALVRRYHIIWYYTRKYLTVRL